MANTELGRQLTVRHRERQLQLRAAVLQQFMRLWPVWNVGDPQSFDLLVQAALPVVRSGQQASGVLSRDYYRAYRMVEEITGQTPSVALAQFNEEQVRSSMYATGEAQARRSIASGFPLDEVKRTALVTMAGSVTRHVANGGRQTLVDTIREDNQAIGWERMTGRDPCAFCAMIASRGAVFKSAESASKVGFGSDAAARGFADPHGRIRGTRNRGQSYHDHCQCYVEARFLGDPFLSEENRGYRDLWDESTKGEEDALNAFRRALGDSMIPVA